MENYVRAHEKNYEKYFFKFIETLRRFNIMQYEAMYSLFNHN